MACGGASTIAAGAVGTLARRLLGLVLPEGTVLWQVARCMLCVALIEEFCKQRAARRGSVRCRMDPLLCCVLVAIGFDLVENLGYSTTATLAVSVMRALTSTTRHVLCGVIMGAMLDKAKRARSRGNEAQMRSVASVAVPAAVHGLYDLCLYALPSTAALAFVLAYGVAGTAVAVRLVRDTLTRRTPPC